MTRRDREGRVLSPAIQRVIDRVEVALATTSPPQDADDVVLVAEACEEGVLLRVENRAELESAIGAGALLGPFQDGRVLVVAVAGEEGHQYPVRWYALTAGGSA